LVELIASAPGAFAEQQGGDLAVGFVTASSATLPPPSVIEDYWHSSSAERFEQATNFVRSYSDELPLLDKILSRIEAPVLVLAGAQDPIVPPANGEFLVAGIRRCRQVLLAGGHLIWEDAPGEYGAEIANWIGGAYESLGSVHHGV
jgi:pimeloyl-ACP methyl ester carboxylesterase